MVSHSDAGLLNKEDNDNDHATESLVTIERSQMCCLEGYHDNDDNRLKNYTG